MPVSLPPPSPQAALPFKTKPKVQQARTGKRKTLEQVGQGRDKGGGEGARRF
jgi:hypothetical protein